MQQTWVTGVLLTSLLAAMPVPTGADEGQAVFEQRCAACHSIGGGRLVGPDLAGVAERRDRDWLRRFVRSSQTLVAGGDATAKALFDEFKIPMPDHADLSEAQIDGVLDHIAAAGSTNAAGDNSAVAVTAGAAVVQPVEPAPPAKPSPELIARGQDLFQGLARLQNGGPACNSCHHVTNDAVIGGGVLARELTTVFSRMGAPGVKAILGSPPFPVMQRAYEGRPLTDDENAALVAFLHDADEHHAYQQPRDYGIGLFYAGLAGNVFLFGFYGLVWARRKRYSTNQAIYDRQIHSQ